MIPRAYVFEWQQHAPWKSNAQTEQDLVIERALIELFSDEIIRENLAFRGGTALHKLYLKPQVRYSEDIDLVQISPGAIKPVLQQIQKKLAFLGLKRSVKSNFYMNTMVYRFDTEVPPIVNSRLKIEINCREHFTLFGYKSMLHSIENLWFSGHTIINTYHIEELLGTKLRALYQRKKGRDLFDLYYALSRLDINPDKVLEAYRAYMSFSNGRFASAKEFLINMELKMRDDAFSGDISAILRTGVRYNMDNAYQYIKDMLISKI